MASLRQSRAPNVRNLIAFSAMIMLLFSLIVVYQASRAYEVAIYKGKLNSDRLTKIMSDQVNITFLSVDLTLRRAIEQQYYNTLFGGNLTEYMRNNLLKWVNETPQITSMMLVDDQGEVKVAAHKKGYETWMDYTRNRAEDSLFTTLKNGDDTDIYIGRQMDKAANDGLISMARRLNKLSGEFDGVVIATVDPRYFLQFFNSVEVGVERFMSVMQLDGSLLLSGPTNSSDNLSLQQNIFDTSLKKPGYVITDLDTVQDEVKIFSYYQLRDLPLMITVVLDESDFLAEWRSARIKDIGFLAIFMVFGSVLSFFALTMARQITRVEESEASAILASQAKSEFLANMSHELRTPLNAIIGFSEMITSGYFGDITDKQRERLNDIHLCGSHLLQLINDILEFSKGDAGKLELNEENVDASEILDECTRIMADKVKTKNINLIKDIEVDLPTIWADKRKIRQMILNLLSNAVKFTPDEGEIIFSAKRDHTGSLSIAVSDTGIGIPEDKIHKALSVFGQVHRSQSHEGTGLGLPLCKMFAELHSGRLTLVSTVGQGTTVRIVIPSDRVGWHQDSAISLDE
jgi:signal transduction histidine kinase